MQKGLERLQPRAAELGGIFAGYFGIKRDGAFCFGKLTEEQDEVALA
ncbi:hypothetical protein [Thalassovita sp.]|nr:hypothetical protein [Thalassovita sp.]